ncbi:MAG: YHS domain-containing protein [Gammaproteobacteria bacterium]
MVNDPVCGMTIEIKNAAAQEEYQDTTLYFCSKSCHSKFLANPAQYNQADVLTDPVCGMKVTKNSDHHMQYAKQNYYFCCDSCLDKFRVEPGQYT